MVLRYVLKRELLASPTMDIVGHRLKNHFVRRTSLAVRHEIQRIGQLGENLAPNEGVLIFPEGTRFSGSRRQRALRRMAQHADPALYASVEALGRLGTGAGNRSLMDFLSLAPYTLGATLGLMALLWLLSLKLLDDGWQFCALFTDLANPTSNSIDQKIGYKPVCDYAQFKFEP